MGQLAQGLLAHRRLRLLTRALPNAYWANQGLKGFAEPYRRFREC